MNEQLTNEINQTRAWLADASRQAGSHQWSCAEDSLDNALQHIRKAQELLEKQSAKQ